MHLILRPFSSSVLLVMVSGLPAFSQIANSIPPPRALITQAVDNGRRVALKGNTRSAANAENDRGRVSEGLLMDHMLLQLQRSPEAEQALEQYTKDLQNPASPN